MSRNNGKQTKGIGNVACIGAGAMGKALAAGMVRAGLVAPEHVWLADADETRLQETARELGARTASNGEAVEAADVVIVAVKPDVVVAVLQEAAPRLKPETLVVSVAAGVTLRTLESFLPPDTPVVRVMPNTPALVGAGATALAKGRHATDDHVDAARRIFGSVGETVVVPEPLLDAVTGLSGSGPAYVYVFIEALADGGVAAGLPRDVALQLAAQTVLGAARMVLETGHHPGALKDMVTSPAGTTIAGVKALEDGGLRGTAIRAVIAAAERSRQLGREQEDASP